MPIDIDGIAVLQAITLAPKLFPDAAPEINNFARKYVVGQLKPTTINLERLRDIYRAIGGEAIVLILDYQTDSASAALVKKLDKDNPNVKATSPVWCRKRIADLASGASAPAEKPPKPVPKTPKKGSKGKKSVLTPEQENLATELKAMTINLDKARGLWLETGEASFTLVLGRLTKPKAVSLAKKFDKDNPDLRTASPEWCRQRIADLASGGAEPVFKNILEYTSMKVTRIRTPKPK
ncbi:MAG: hypothetical protein ACREC9_11600 [Methylocella sp.]